MKAEVDGQHPVRLDRERNIRWRGAKPGYLEVTNTKHWHPHKTGGKRCWRRINNNNNITSIALQSSGARAQKRNKTKSVIIFKSRGHTGVIITLSGRRLFKVEKQFWRDKFWDFYGKRQDFHKTSMWLGVHSKWWVQQLRKHACPGSV